MNTAAARQSASDADETAGDIEARARALVNPTSGLANDYLNIFNELVMLVEQLPETPEFAEDVLAWRPKTYREYFSASILPGSKSALDAYEKLDVKFKTAFEGVVAELERVSTGSVAGIRRLLKKGEAAREELAAQCAKTSGSMREILQKASNLIDHGSATTDENAQRRADRLLAVRIKALQDMEDFNARPRFAQG